MISLEALRRQMTLRTFVIIAGIVAAPILGVAMAEASRGQIVLLGALGAVLGVVAIIYLPIEVFILSAMFAGMLADTNLAISDAVFYARFIPMGMLALRSMIDVSMHRWFKPRVELSFLLPGIAFFILALFSTSYSLTPALTFQRVLSMGFVIVSFGLGLPNYLRTFDRTSRLVKMVIVLIGAFVLLGVVLGTSGGNGVSEEQSFIRVNGFFGNPNTQGLIAMLIFFPLVWWWQSETQRLAKGVLALLVVIWAFLILITGSRASFLGLVGGGIIFAVLYGRSSWQNALLVVTAIGLTLTLALTTPEFARVLDFQTENDAPVAPGELRQVDRPFLIQRAIELGMQSPIFGVGFSASDVVFENDRPNLVSQGIFISGSHNSYTRMFVDLGVVGVVVGFAIFVIILGRAFLAPTDIRRDPFLVMLVATVIAGLINGFFEDWLFGFGSSSTLPLWFFLALIPIRLTQLRQAEPEVISLSPIPLEANL